LIGSKFLIIAFLALMALPISANAAEHGGGGGEGEASAASAEGAFSYVDIDAITIPIITQKGLSQQFTFSVSLEVTPTHEGEVSKFGPRLTDAYIRDLYGALGAGYGFMHSGVIDANQIKDRLKVVTNKVLSPAHLEVNDVLLRVVQQYSF